MGHACLIVEKKERLVIEDAARRQRAISSIHDSAHLGINRTLDMVTAKYYWPGLTRDVKQYVSKQTGVHVTTINRGTSEFGTIWQERLLHCRSAAH